MKRADRNALITFPVLVFTGTIVALAGSQGGRALAGIPIFALMVGVAYLVQWGAFFPAYVFQTEKFFDLTGSITYIFVITTALFLSSNMDGRSVLLFSLVVIWALRLGIFLFHRIHVSGKDDRFDKIKPSFIRFLNVWTIQGLWVTFTIAAALVAITTKTRKELGFIAVAGFIIWIVGFTVEVVSDIQKSRFNANPHNKGKFINTGLWSRSRHPNYFGEITIWIGVAVIAIPVLHGWQWVALISPVFVTLLLTRVSGVPLLERKADKKWGGQEDYEAYKKRTPVLIPRIRK